MDYEEIKTVVDGLVKAAKPYDTEGLDMISDELEKLREPISAELKSLAADESVRRYIELRLSADYIKESRRNLSGYYPK